MGATKLLNLERHRVEVLKAEVEQLKAAIRDNWGRDTLELATANASVNLCCRCSAVAVLPTAAQTDLCRPRRLRRLVLPASVPMSFRSAASISTRTPLLVRTSRPGARGSCCDAKIK